MRIVEENATQPLPTLVAPPVVMEDPVQKAEAPMSAPARQIPVRQTSPAPAVSAPPAVATLAASGAVALAVAGINSNLLPTQSLR